MGWRSLAAWCWMGAGAALALAILNVADRPWMAAVYAGACWWLTDLGRQAWQMRPKKR